MTTSAGSTSTWVSTTSVSSSGKRIQREMVELNMDPPPDCSAGPKGDNLYHWVATIIGPPGTPYQGGIYFLDIKFPGEYPFKPPEVISGTTGYSLGTCSNINVSNIDLKYKIYIYELNTNEIVFRTRVFHCNVDSSGNVSLEIVKDGWSPALTITKVLLAIRSIFTKPDPYNPLVPSIAHLYLADKAKHDELASEWTMRFAK